MTTSGHSALAEIIRRRIEEAGSRGISFRDYMELCLYEPEYGYYVKPVEKIGKNGDFYTSSQVGTLMGEMLARFILKEMAGIPRAALVEWGAGNGLLARQILDEILARDPNCYAGLTYVLIEASPFHRSLQKRQLADHEGIIRFMEADAWLQAEPEDFTIVLSNELLDAFPVYRVIYTTNGWMEERVSCSPDKSKFVSIKVPLDEPRVLEYLRSRSIRPMERQVIEVNLQAYDWIRTVASRIRNGLVITIDYGGPEEELYAPHRMEGTLLCYRQHRASGDPYCFPGEQDITSHVNFSACIEAGKLGGIREWSLETQKRFLVEQGILEELRDHAAHDPFSAEARRNRAIRQLLLSDQMSELFKVLIQRK